MLNQILKRFSLFAIAISVSTLGYAQWFEVATPTLAKSYGLSTITFANNQIGYAAGSYKDATDSTDVVLKTTDGGTTWSLASTIKDHLTFGPNDIVTIGPDTVIMTSGSWSGQNVIRVSYDAGVNWITHAPNAGIGMLPDVDVSSTGDIYVAGKSRTVLKSTDGGQNFVVIVDTLNQGTMRTLETWGDTIITSHGSWRPWDYVSYDGGTTWVTKRDAAQYAGFRWTKFFSGQKGIGVGKWEGGGTAQIRVTHDAWTTWGENAYPANNYSNIAFVDAVDWEYIYAVDRNTLFLSQNGAQLFDTLSFPVAIQNSNANNSPKADFLKDGLGFFVYQDTNTIIRYEPIQIDVAGNATELPETCPGGPISVQFDVPAAYTIGNNNTWTLEMSDANKNFTGGQTVLGTGTGNSGIISGNIPTTVTDTTYLLRIVGSDVTPSIVSSNRIFIKISSNVAAPAVTAVDDKMVLCGSGDEVKLVATSGYSSYSWNGTTGSDTLTITTPGKYAVQGTQSGCASASSDSVEVQQVNLMAPTVMAYNGSTTVCDGEPVKLYASASYDSLMWSNNTTADTIMVSSAGSYTATGYTMGCASPTSTALDVTTQSKPSSIINAGDTIKTSTLPVPIPADAGFDTYTWNTGSNNSDTIHATTTGTYSLTITLNGCTFMDSVYVELITGLSLNQQAADVRIFPNPSHGLLQIEASREVWNSLESIRIVDVNGRLVRNLTGPFTGNLQLNNLKTGMYFLQLNNAESTATFKLLVK